MPLLTTGAAASSRALGFASLSSTETLGGMVLITPTSIASTGTGNSSSIGANGSVTFSSCSTLQLNGVFSSFYDNYMIVIRSASTNSNNDSVNIRFASGGTVTTDFTYDYQYISALGSSVTAGRFGAQSAARIGNSDNEQRDGDVTYVFGPFLSQPTVLRNVHVYGDGGAGIVDFASTHNQSTSYDGFWLQCGSGLFTGLISVYGLGG